MLWALGAMNLDRRRWARLVLTASALRHGPSRGAAVTAWRAWGADAWWLPAADGPPSSSNGGHIAPLVAVQSGSRLWLLGTGPTPTAGEAIARSLREVSGTDVTDVVVPFAHPALALGARSLATKPAVRHWAHADVIAAMRRRCASCAERWRAQLAEAGESLGAEPVHLPDHVLRGAAGRLGPLRWWRLSQGPTSPTTAWVLPGGRRWYTPGLSWGGEVPDLADTDLDSLRAGLMRLLAVLPTHEVELLGQQGAPASRSVLLMQYRYLETLERSVRRAQLTGARETEASLAPIGASAADKVRHSLNWQHAWRELERDTLDPTRR